jgi:cyclopropane fatty-acyl-phospholipid synthase-like methyltransferase
MSFLIKLFSRPTNREKKKFPGDVKAVFDLGHDNYKLVLGTRSTTVCPYYDGKKECTTGEFSVISL